ncbi:MAG TPA: ABC transporter permease [Thermoanaerobaculia bacterium]|nr:ABC transporter permease [Thermoanaerobaculia bacterium]
MENLLRDLRVAVRTLVARPLFTLTALVALGAGIGLNTAIFSVLEAVLLRPLPYPQPDRLVTVWLDNRVQGWPEDLMSFPYYESWRERSRTLEDLAAYRGSGHALTGEGEPERLTGVAVTGNFFSLLGVEPLLGRSIGPDDDRPGHDDVAVLSHALWQRRFGGDEAIVGRSVSLDARPITVVGVMPPSFTFPARVKDMSERVDLWVPLAVDDRRRNAAGSLWLWSVGRLEPGITIEAARADLDVVAATMPESFPDGWSDFGITAVGLREHLVGDTRTGVLLLMGAVVFVLLIAIANVANLLLARATEREREMSLRAALGARRGRLVRQLLTESLVLALCGGVLGMALAIGGMRAILALAPADLPLDGVTVSPVALAFTLGVSLLAGVAFGLVPALRLAAAGGRYREGARGARGAGREGRWLRRFLVAGELALAAALLVGSGLMLRTLAGIQGAQLGFDADRLLTVRLSLPRASYEGPLQVIAFFDRLVERIRAIPGVERASATNTVLLDDFPNSTIFVIEGQPPPPREEAVEVTLDSLMPGFFETAGIPVLEGRALDERDTAESAPVVMINAELRRRFFGGESPLGKRIAYGRGGEGSQWLEIVGVAGDTLRNGLDREVRAETYLPYSQNPARTMAVLARVEGDPGSVAASVRAAVRELDRDLPVGDVLPLRAQVAERQAHRRFYTALLGVFSALALALAAVGIYGVLSYTVQQRFAELGLRMALGARRRDVFLQVLGGGLALAVCGIGLGLLLAAALTRFLRSLLWEVSPTDPLTFALLAGVLFVIAAIACAVPARRATRVDPGVALRWE